MRISKDKNYQKKFEPQITHKSRPEKLNCITREAVKNH